MTTATCGVCLGAIPDGEQTQGHTALCAQVVLQRSEGYRKALEEIREMMSPANREVFVTRGMLAFSRVYQVVEKALGAQ